MQMQCNACLRMSSRLLLGRTSTDSRQQRRFARRLCMRSSSRCSRSRPSRRAACTAACSTHSHGGHRRRHAISLHRPTHHDRSTDLDGSTNRSAAGTAGRQAGIHTFIIRIRIRLLNCNRDVVVVVFRDDEPRQVCVCVCRWMQCNACVAIAHRQPVAN